MSPFRFEQIERTDSFLNDYAHLPREIQERTEKAISLLVNDIRHPSLKARKIKGVKEIWEARITLNCRLTFRVLKGGVLQLRRVGTHSVLKTP